MSLFEIDFAVIRHHCRTTLLVTLGPFCFSDVVSWSVSEADHVVGSEIAGFFFWIGSERLSAVEEKCARVRFKSLLRSKAVARWKEVEAKVIRLQNISYFSMQSTWVVKAAKKSRLHWLPLEMLRSQTEIVQNMMEAA